MSDSDGRTVVVTGGSKGLGLAMVDAFLDNGDRVASCSRKPTSDTDQRASALPGRFLHRSVDVADRAQASDFVRDVIDQWGRIDVLVNNAGVAADGMLALLSDDELDTIVDLNVKATIYLTRLVSRRMLRQGSGSIINISSIVGLTGYRGLAAYGATKAALDGFTRGLARELGARGIRVNSVAPGYVATEMTHGLDADQLRQIERRTPLGRLAEASDVAAAVRFLASPDAAMITGQVLVVDGGLTA